ncbi:MAG TPA: ribose 5-phosphate isomerase B [Desulfobacteraceae bacterium]|nr:ribose 5-phosphate isomerase B [Desulfobacteraceae bacterium]
MKIAIGSDHAGFKYKEKIKWFLAERGHTVDDFGTDSEEPVDYPLFILPVAKALSRGTYHRGIVLGGSGNGEAIAANRIPGIRCALCWNIETARLARSHNDANMLSLGARLISIEQAMEIVDTWLNTPFDAGRHLRRIGQIDQETCADRDGPESHEGPPRPPGKTMAAEGSGKRTKKSENYDLLISFRSIKYMEGKNSLEFEVEPSMKKPTVVHVPSPESWKAEVPAWATDRRTEILERIKPKCSHLDWEWKEH